MKALGADRVINYAQEDFTQGDERYDIVFDAVSKRSFGACRRALTPKGIYVNTLPAASVLLNRYLTGFFTGRKARTVMVRPNAAAMEWMKARIEEGGIRIVIDRTYPIERIRDAFAYSEAGRTRGKVVLTVG